MSSIDRKRLRVTGKHRAQRDSHVDVRESREGAIIVVTQAFGPRGDSLIGHTDVKFDDFPAITLLVDAGGKPDPRRQRQGRLHRHRDGHQGPPALPGDQGAARPRAGRER
jgi:hypothetical protein